MERRLRRAGGRDGYGVEGEKVGVAVGAGVAFAAASASVDGTGEKVRGDGLFDDNATPGRVYFPYDEIKK